MEIFLLAPNSSDAPVFIKNNNIKLINASRGFALTCYTLDVDEEMLSFITLKYGTDAAWKR